MSIFDGGITPTEPDVVQVASTFKRQVVRNYNRMIQMHENIHRSFWNNSKATPDEINAELGTRAADVFQFSIKIKQAILALNPSAILSTKPSEYSVTINGDGTVTLTQT